jgi:hypothetical protein
MSLTALEWAEKRNASRIRDQAAAIESMNNRKLLSRSEGACADKIIMQDVLDTVTFLAKRAEALKAAPGVVRMRRHMKHALRNGDTHTLEGFARTLAFSDGDTLAAVRQRQLGAHGGRKVLSVPKKLLVRNGVSISGESAAKLVDMSAARKGRSDSDGNVLMGGDRQKGWASSESTDYGNKRNHLATSSSTPARVGSGTRQKHVGAKEEGW